MKALIALCILLFNACVLQPIPGSNHISSGGCYRRCQHYQFVRICNNRCDVWSNNECVLRRNDCHMRRQCRAEVVDCYRW